MSKKQTPQMPAVSFKIAAAEFELLAAFMAPLRFDESEGESIWVTSMGGSKREWIVATAGVTVVVSSHEAEVQRWGMTQDQSWAFPIPEHVLVTMGKFIQTSQELTITLSDQRVILSSDLFSMNVSQNPLATRPPLVPTTESLCTATVDATGFWTMLSAARVWPTGAKAEGMNTPLRCHLDFTTNQLVFNADWTIVEAGVHEYRMPAEFGPVSTGVNLKPFNIPHTAILSVLRNPGTLAEIGNIEFHVAPEGVDHLMICGENWSLYFPTIANVEQWGHDLDEVIGDIAYVWKDCSLIKMFYPDLEQGEISLSALPNESRYGLYKYRVSYQVLDDVVPTLALYSELDAINEVSAGCRVVIEGTRVLAVADLTQENYLHLNSHIEAFASNVAGLGPILSAISLS